MIFIVLLVTSQGGSSLGPDSSLLTRTNVTNKTQESVSELYLKVS